MTDLKPGMKVTFSHYGEQKTGVVDRVVGQIVFLTDGRWLHRKSVEPT
ncbi:hypothetical protein [Rhizobium arsenicireducens]